MTEIWLWVLLLLACFFAIQSHYLRKDYKKVMQHWQLLEQALQKRLDALKTFVSENAETAENLSALQKEIKPLETRKDDRLKKLIQRAALESRLSREAATLLNNKTPELHNTLTDLENTIKTSLRYYQISANRYNLRLESVSGKLLSTLSTLEPAPELKIEYICD